MKNGITKRLTILLIVAFVMALVLSLSGNTSSPDYLDLNNIPSGGEAGITSIPNLDVEIIPVTIVPESALRYAGDK